VAGSGTNDPESDAHIIASLRMELAAGSVRELELELRILELESDRWRTFTLVELEWITSAFLEASDDQAWSANTLAEQANRELERRARQTSDLDPDLE
jgi:hypothetical protein